MDVPRARRSVWSVAALVAFLVLVTGTQSAVAQSGRWGNTDAYYTDGIICQQNGSAVPLAAWLVNGSVTAYAVSDIVETGGVYRPAPSAGASAPIGAGQGGLTGTDVGAAAYLIQHHATGPAGVAETSADIAAVAGGGSLQAQCLGQSGTSVAGAAAALSEARRYAGPYTVQVDASANSRPGQLADVTATVLSASGVPTPGIDVSFTINGSVTTAATGSDGKARTSAPTPSAAVPVRATVTEPVSLTYFSTTPASVALAAPAAANGTATLRPAPPPHPVVSVATPALVLASGTVTPVVSVRGTFSYPGAGAIVVAGPVTSGAHKTCNSLGSGDFTRAPQAWVAQFDFTGDGSVRAGSTPALTPGCYSATASVQITNSTPSVRAVSGFSEDATVLVSTMQIAASSAQKIATPGTLSSTITATNPGRAVVSSTIVAYGPLPPKAGDCTALDWTKAAPASVSDAAALKPTSDAKKLSATITAQVSKIGCYAVSARSVVTQDGRTATVQDTVGRPEATTLVTMPSLAVVTSSYGGEQGQAMTGTVTVLGAYSFAGVVRIGLRASTSSPVNGCRSATYDTTSERTAPTSVATAGDGTYAFRTPIAPRNRCYAITGALTLTANPMVRADSPTSDSSIFLAGAQSRPTTFNDSLRGTGSGTLRTTIAFGIAGGILLVLAAWVMVQAYVSARAYDELGGGWTWRPYRAEDALTGFGGSLPRRPRPKPRPLP